MSDSLVIRAGSKLITLAKDVQILGAISELLLKKDEVEEALSTVLSPSVLVSKLEDLNEDDALYSVLETLDLLDEAQKVSSHITRLRNKHGDEFAAIETLLTPVGSYHPEIAHAHELPLAGPNLAEINWDIISSKSDLSVAKKEIFGLDLSADLEIAVDAAANWTFSDTLPRPLLSLGLEADAAVDGKGSVAFNPFALEAEGGMNAGLEVEFYYHVKNPRSVVAAQLLPKLKRLPNLFSYHDLWSVFANPSLGLEGIRLSFDRELAFDLGITLGQKFAFTKDIDVDAGLSINIGVRRPSSLEMTFMAGNMAEGGGRQIKACLSRDRTREREFGASVGVTLDLTKLAPKVHELLKDALGTWEKGLDEIKPFLSPGTYISNQLKGNLAPFIEDLLDDEALSEALTADLGLLLGHEAHDEAKVADWLVDQLSGQLDKVGAGKFLDNSAANTLIEDAAKTAASKISGLLPRIGGTDFAGQLEDKIVTLATSQATKLREDFTGKVEELVDGQAKALTRELKRLGDKTKGLITSADDAAKRIGELIERYDALFRKVVKATEDTAWAQISASIFLEEERTDTTSLQFTGTFLADDDTAAQVFDALLYGKIQSAATVLVDDNPSFHLDAEKSSIRRYTKSSSKLGYELVVFGIEVGGTRLITGEADIIAGANGSVSMVAKGLANVEKDGRGESREASFNCTNSILLARALAGQPQETTRMVDLGFSFSHKDRHLARKELDGLVQSLINVDLLPPSERLRAITKFNSWGGKGKNAEIRATVDIGLGLDRTGILKLLGLNEASQHAELSFADEARITEAYRAMRAKYDKAGSKEGHIETYQEMIEEMRRVYLSRPAGLRTGSETDQSWTKDDYETSEKKIAKLAHKRIKHLNRSIFKSDGFGSELDREFLIFIAVLKQLSTGAAAQTEEDPSGRWHTNVVITHRPKKGNEEVFVLV